MSSTVAAKWIYDFAEGSRSMGELLPARSPPRGVLLLRHQRPTQTGLGFSRDDIEAAIVPHYVATGIVERSPFATIDERGVGELVQIAIERGREARAGLDVGICGEHGGDRTSIRSSTAPG